MKGMGIFFSMIMIMVIGFFAIGFSDSVAAPAPGAALNQYNNLSTATTLAGNGMWATMIILVAAMLFAAIIYMAGTLKKRRA